MPIILLSDIQGADRVPAEVAAGGPAPVLVSHPQVQPLQQAGGALSAHHRVRDIQTRRQYLQAAQETHIYY